MNTHVYRYITPKYGPVLSMTPFIVTTRDHRHITPKYDPLLDMAQFVVTTPDQRHFTPWDALNLTAPFYLSLNLTNMDILTYLSPV